MFFKPNSEFDLDFVDYNLSNAKIFEEFCLAAAMILGICASAAEE